MDTVQIKKVDRYTRAGEDGRVIVCKCNAPIRVFHFAWTAIKCVDCGQDVKKEEYTVGLTEEQKYKWVWEGRKGHKTLVKRINTALVDVEDMDINRSDYPDFCDSYIVEASWADGSKLIDEELDELNMDGDYLYKQIEHHLY
jgi:endogenous inhibitor of DNA gyrase (YacG/DUF329 family)